MGDWALGIGLGNYSLDRVGKVRRYRQFASYIEHLVATHPTDLG